MGKILCVLDGMTDRGFHAEAYSALSSMRRVCEVNTVPPGKSAESLTCILTLLGVRDVPQNLRGYTDALGAGIPVGERDLVLRGSWFALDEAGCCACPTDAPPGFETGDARVSYTPMGGYKSILVVKGVAEWVGHMRTEPPYACAGRRPEDLMPQNAGFLDALCRTWVRDGRCLIPWGQSMKGAIEPFPLPAAAVAGATIVKGIARLLGMDLIDTAGATGDTDTDLAAKTAAALEAAQRYPFVLLHLNGADEAAHRLDAAQKHAFLRRADAQVLAPLLASGHEITAVADHATEPDTGLHAGTPQPVFTNAECPCLPLLW